MESEARNTDGIIQERSVDSQNPKDYFKALGPNATCPFRHCFGLVTPFSFHFNPFWMRTLINVTLCLSHHCILGAGKVFSGFADPQMKTDGFVQGWIILRASLILNLVDLDNETCAFDDETYMKLWIWDDAVMLETQGDLGIRWMFSAHGRKMNLWASAVHRIMVLWDAHTLIPTTCEYVTFWCRWIWRC